MTARLVAAVIAGYGVLLLWAWALCRAAARCPECDWCGLDGHTGDVCPDYVEVG